MCEILLTFLAFDFNFGIILSGFSVFVLLFRGGVKMYERLFEINDQAYTGKIVLRNKHVIYKPKQALIGQKELYRMILFARYINRNAYKKLDVVIDLSNNKFIDKLAYIFLEYICKYILYSNRNLYLILNKDHDIYTAGIKHSPLNYLRSIEKSKREEFLHRFNKDICERHYRQLAHVYDDSIDTLPSKYMTDITCFLTTLGIDKESSVAIATVISELVDNAIDHGENDVLLDIDVTNDYIKKNEQGIYYGVNIVVMNFSRTLLNTKVENKLKSNKYIDNRMKKVKEAYDNHKNHFDYRSYGENEFYILASFQNQITGRDEMTITGGTGLTTLISNLADKSDAYRCYVVSGNSVLNFISDLLLMNDDNWYGFNKENDFINSPPDKACFTKCDYFMPGTAYNLNFVLKKED